MMFEPGLTKGMLEVFVAPTHHPHCSADDQSTKAIDIQNAYLNGMPCLPQGKDLRFPFDRAYSQSSLMGACPGLYLSLPEGNPTQTDIQSEPGLKRGWLPSLNSKTRHWGIVST